VALAVADHEDDRQGGDAGIDVDRCAAGEVECTRFEDPAV
jgi:hypothetical protein